MYKSRLMKELKDLENDQTTNIKLIVDEKDIKNWTGEIIPPTGTPYHGFKLKLKLSVNEDYPLSSPKVTFCHPIYHPNIGSSGNICLDILGSQWTPTYTLMKVMLSICCLLSDPNPDSPLNSEAARYWRNDRERYNNESKKLCDRHCEKIQNLS